jgi:GT2 family glycosyltransferase
MTATFGCVVLTTGSRPDVLALALESLDRQRGVELDTVVVFNGAQPPPGVRGLGLAEDVGIPAARNAGAGHVGGELLFFLDDDASLVDDDALARVAAQFGADSTLGALQLGVAPRDGGAYSRDWVPRLRVGDRSRPSNITVVWEGAVAARRSVFEAVGGWPAPFRFVHEGIDLGWRVMDAGSRVFYAGGIVALHPVTGLPPHGYSFYFGARNRVWLARRHLPAPLGVVYVLNFALRSLPRYRTGQARREALRGYRDGLRQPAGPRKPLRWSTIRRMAAAGRPPIM